MSSSPILSQIGGIFIPVSSIEQARDWYCDILGVPADGDILFGHLYILSVNEGIDLILDSKIFTGDNVFQAPAFQFKTHDIKEAYDYMKSKQVELTTEIMYDQWFNFKDPDGNQLMICKC